MQILPDYLDYLENKNHHSLLVKFYGVFKIITKNNVKNEEVIVIVMKNVSQCSIDKVLKVYDLKGSTHKR